MIQISTLMPMMQGKNGKGWGNAQNKAANTVSTNKGNRISQNSQRTGNSYHNPTTTAAGPFRGKKKPLQCFRCYGWAYRVKTCGTPETTYGGGLDNLPPNQVTTQDVPPQS